MAAPEDDDSDIAQGDDGARAEVGYRGLDAITDIAMLKRAAFVCAPLLD
ncbi:hypothetical protein V473_17165 [Sphingobium cupriresistens LL01]|uniref:Uncharacterized protein n=1 Tax=Sphingobium cupriresistens LL01 TaxID=1420583 RepID=A0A0J7XR59_9SPHN|nr:hypothetical protein V473_17165 [Sphingobium cupriresistens LL01]